MVVRTSFDLRGLDEYLDAVARAGNDVDEAVAEALDESAEILLTEMKVRVPKDTRNLERHLEKTETKRDGNFTFVEVGLGAETYPDADTARYGNAQEYGYRRGGTFYQPQSYIRTSWDKKKSLVFRRQRESLQRKGFVD